MRQFLASLRVRLMLLVLLAVIPAVVLVVLVAAEQRRMAAAEAQSSALGLARLIAGEHEHVMDTAYQLLAALAQVPAVRTYDAPVCEKLLANLRDQEPQHRNIFAIKPDGEVFCSAVPPSTPDLSGRSWFQRVVQTNAFALGEYGMDADTSAAVLPVAYPVTDASGNLLAVVAASLDFSWLQKYVEESHSLPGITLSILDGKGTVMAHFPEGQEWIGRVMSDSPAARAALVSRKDGMLEETCVGSASVCLFAYARLHTAPGGDHVYLQISVPAAAAYAVANTHLLRDLFWLGLTTLFALAAAWVVGDLVIVRYARALLRAAARVRSGDYSVRTGLGSPAGELGKLARAFDEMALALEHREVERHEAEERIQRLNAELEMRVSERTAQLADANRELQNEILEREQAENALRRFAEEQSVLYSVTATAARSLDRATLLPAILDIVLPVLDAQAGWVLEMDGASGEQHRILAAVGLPAGLPGSESAARVSACPCTVCVLFLTGHKPAVDQGLVGACPCLPHESLASADLRSHIGIPLVAGQHLLGILNVGWTQEHTPSASDRALLVTIGQQVGVVLENAQLFESAQRRAQHLATLNEIGQALTSTLDVDQVLATLLERVRRAIPVETAAVALLDTAADEVVFRQAVGAGREVLAGLRMRCPGSACSCVERLQREVVTADLAVDPCYLSHLAPLSVLQVRDLVRVPLIVRDRPIGMVNLINRQAGQLNAEEVSLLESMAAQAAVAIENARLFQAEREQRELAETLREVDAALVATLDVDAVLDRLLDQIGRVVPHDAASIILLDGADARLVRWRGYEGFDLDPDTTVRYAMSGDTPLRQMLETRAPVVVSDAHQEPGWQAANEMPWLRSYAAAPICVRGETLGFLNLTSSTPGFFKPEHGERLRAFADQAGIALDNARLYQREREQFRRLQESQAQVIQAEKMAALGRLSATLAHEINNPLQAIQSHLELVVDFPLQAEERTAYLEITRQEIERLAGLAHRVLNFARPAHAPRSAIELSSLIYRTLALAGKQLQQSHIEISVELLASPMVMAAPEPLTQVFLNLVINAIEAIGEGGCIHICCDADGDEARLSFYNDGPVIPPEHLLHIFEPFFTTKRDGTGLGLPVSHGLVEQYGGRLSVENVGTERGVAFTVTLPLAHSGEN